MAAALEHELETFHRELPKLLQGAGNRGKYALVYGDLVSGVFATVDAALEAGYERFGLNAFLVKEITDHEELHLVLGMVKDKDIEKILSLLPRHAHFYFTRAQIPRALPENQLAAMAAAIGMAGNHYPDVNTAVREAINRAGSRDLIIVCGSVFVVGELDISSLFR